VRTVKHDVRHSDEEVADSMTHEGGGGTLASHSMAAAVSEAEAARFATRRQSGRTLSHVHSSTAQLDGIRVRICHHPR